MDEISAVRMIGEIVGTAIGAYLLTGLITLFMRSRLKDFDHSDFYIQTKNAIWYRASLWAYVIVLGSGINRVLQSGAMLDGLPALVGGALVIWEFWRRPRN